MELATLLEKESLENGNLQREISSLQYELKTIKIDFDELASVNKNMQNTIDILQSKMQNVLSTYGESSNELCFCHESAAQESESRDLTGIVFRFEELHHNTCQKIQQLMQENKSIIDEKDRAQVSLSKAESDILLLKQKFEHDLSNMIDKLSVSSAVSQKLQLKFEAIADKLKASSKVEENYAHGHTQLFSDLDCLEVELQQLSCKNRDIAEEILALQVVTEELDWSKQTIATLTKEKQALMASLQSKSEESAKLALEVDSIKKSLQCMHDELHGERSLRDELNSTVMDITFQLNEKQSLLLDFEQQKSELIQKIGELTEKNQDLIVSLQDKSEESAKLALEVDLFKKSLQSMHDEVHGERSLRSKLKSTVTDITSQLSEKNHQLLDIEQQKSELSQKIVELSEENQALVVSLRNKSEEAAKLALEVNTFKESLQSLHNDLDGERSLRDELKSTATDLSYQLNEKHCQLIDFDQQKTQLIQKVAELTKENQVLMVSLQRKSAESAKLALEVNAFKESMQSLHDELNGERSLMDELKITVTDITSQLNEKQCQLIDLDEQKTELFQKMEELTKENQALMLSLQIKSAESTKLELEIKTSKESLQCLPDELHSERSLRDELQSTVTDLTSQLNEKNCQLQDFDRQKSELVHLKQLVADLELEKSRACNVFLHCEKRLEIASDESKSASSLEAQLSDMHELLLAADVRLIFTRTQYEAYVDGLVQQLYSTGRLLTELHTKNLDVETILNGSVAREAHCNKENVRLLRSLDTERSQLHSSIAENRILLGRNSILTTELEEYKNRVESRAVSYDEDKSQLALEVERMKHMLVGSKEEIDDLVMCREELDIQCLVLKGKLKEQSARIILFERCNDELMMLQNRYDELTRKLSEQILKAEEFRNLSIHLKELKDRAEAECIQLREKRESEGPPTGMQESLRIAFIKEQYETKLQELKHQLSISKKHSEEMLWKLQDAIDEIENRKKSEASHLKKNEELGMKILELEAELQSVISDKREKMRAYDLLKAELECSLMSLECCKEEKQKLEASLQECYEEKSKLSIDLTTMRAVLDSSTSTIQKESTDGLHTESCITVSNGQMGDGNPKYLERESMMNYDDPQNTCLECIDESSSSNALMDEHLEQGLLVSSSLSAYPSLALVNQGNLNISKSKPLAIINDQFREQSLKSSMEYLNEELERMKSENSLVSYDNHHVDLKFPGLQRELMQLNKVNEELGTIYPVFNDQPGSGNAIERVLALEIELAEALQAKKKSSIHFQSSFLKQHNDEKAIFRSFRDINELIKEILEVKGRYAAVETELKEMHDRYSQLSLQFAEVEGERQKLMMTLKNVRASKRTLQLFRSSSASLGDSE